MLLLRRKHPPDDAALLRRAPELAVRVDEPRDDEREDRDDVDDLVRAPRVAPGPADGGEDRDDGRRDEYDHDAVAAPGRHALDAAAQRVQDPAHAATVKQLAARLAELAEESVIPQQWTKPYQGPDYFCADCPLHPGGKGPGAPGAPWL